MSVKADRQSASGWLEFGLAALQSFCLLKSLLMSLSTLMRVVNVVGEFRATVVGSCGEVQAPAVVGGGGGGAVGLEPVGGVTGDGDRPVVFQSKIKSHRYA